MKIQETVINFAVYEDKTEFMGIASVQLPDLTALSQQISGHRGHHSRPLRGHDLHNQLPHDYHRCAEAVRASTP